jgi:hypothetical protein
MPKPLSPEKVTRFLARFGAPTDNAAVNAAVNALLTDAHRYREKLRVAGEGPYKPDARIAELEQENQRLETELDRVSGQLPPQGAVVLAGDEAKAWDVFKGLGKPEDVKKALAEELPALRSKVTGTETATAATEAAKLLGWNAAATVGAITDKGLVVSLVDGKDKDGKAIKVPHVRPAGDDKAATVPLADWVSTNAAYLTPALTATGGSSGSGGTGTQSTTPLTPFPVLSAGGSPAATGDPVADFANRAQAARDARPNPLVPRTAAATT